MWKMFNLAELHLGKFFGIPVSLHFSCWGFLLFQATVSSNAFLLYALVYVIILAHEFGHCFAAYKLGLKTNNIKLYLCGGVASLESTPEQPWKELVISLAGPAINVLFIPILMIASYYHPLAFELAILNVMLLTFNLVPIFPLDGGRVLRSAIAAYSNNYYWSTIIAVRVSQIIICLTFPFFLFFCHINLILISIFLFIAAEMELRLVVTHLNRGSGHDESLKLMLEAHAALMEVARRNHSDK